MFATSEDVAPAKCQRHHTCWPKRGGCTICRQALTVDTLSFEPIVNVNNNILGLQVIGLSHIAKILVNYITLSTYNNIWVGFSCLWSDIYTNVNENIAQCLKFMHYHKQALYTHAIVSIYFNKPVKNWNATFQTKRFYNTVLSTQLMDFSDPNIALQFIENNPKELGRIRKYINWMKTPFVRRYGFISSLLPFYGDFLNKIGSDKLNKDNITSIQLRWLQNELKKACQFSLGDIFDIIVSSGILGILEETDKITLNSCLTLACSGNTGNKVTKLRMIKVLLQSGANVPSLLIPFKFNFIKAAQIYYDLGAELSDPVDNIDNTVLHLACDGSTFDCHEEFFDWIISCEQIGDVIDTQNIFGETPLYVAIANYSEEYTYRICLSLINCMADVNISDLSGETPLFVATSCGYKQIQSLLSQSGAEPLKKKIKM